MTYLRAHNRRGGRVRPRKLIGLLVVLVFLISGIQIAMPHVFPALFHAIALPFWRTEFAVVNGALQSQQELLAENESLKRQIAEYEIRFASSTLELLLTQNQDLLSMFGEGSTSPTNYKLAAVLSRPAFVPYDLLIIDIGSEDGVVASSTVYSPHQIPIGRIVNVKKNTSIVSLFTSPKESYNALIGGTHISAMAIGQGGGQFLAEVPHGTPVSVGDIVVDTILSSRPLGTVAAVSNDPANPFDTILIAPPINIFDVTFVLVE